MKISIATSVFLNYPVEDAVDAILTAGFDGVDIWCGRPHLYRNDHPANLYERLRKQFSEQNASAVSVMPAFFRYPYSLSSPIDAIRSDSVAYMKDCIHNARAVGSSCVMVVPTHIMIRQTPEDARSRFLESLFEVNREAERENVKLAMEIVYPSLSDYLHSSNDALGILRDLGNPQGMGVILDSGHLNLSGKNLESEIQKLGNRILHVHVNDNDGVHQQNEIPGEGTVDFIRLLRLLRSHSYDGFLMAELGWQYSFDPLPAALLALKRIRTYLREAV